MFSIKRPNIFLNYSFTLWISNSASPTFALITSCSKVHRFWIHLSKTALVEALENNSQEYNSLSNPVLKPPVFSKKWTLFQLFPYSAKKSGSNHFRTVILMNLNKNCFDHIYILFIFSWFFSMNLAAIMLLAATLGKIQEQPDVIKYCTF